MTIRNGTAKRIVAFVTRNPGCTRAQMLAACGISELNDAMPAYCRKQGLIHPAGPRGSQRYYPTAEQAQAAHKSIVAAVKAHREAKIKVGRIKQNLLRMAKRRANGARTIASSHRIKLDPGVTLHPEVKITIAAPPKDRWAA